MSYTRIWCLRSESNQRHVDFQSTALPTELQTHIEQSIALCSDAFLATRNGLEPSTSSVTGWRANRLHHRAKYGGNNRARTCDPMLVRHVLSQLSYAPIPFRSGSSNLSDVDYYTQNMVLCQELLLLFLQKYFTLKTPKISGFSGIYSCVLQRINKLCDILRGVFIHCIAELALHREGFALLVNFCQFLFAQA